MSTDEQIDDKVIWPGTLKLALARGFCSGLLWDIFAPASGVTSHLILPFAFAVASIPTAFIFYGVGKILGSFIPFGEAIPRFIAFICVGIGDPIIYAINSAKPEIFNVNGFKLFNIKIMMLIKGT